MKAREFFKKTEFHFLLIFCLLNTAAAASDNELIVLHEAIGDILDAEENAAYNILSADIGFTEARFYYHGKNKWTVHVFGRWQNEIWLQTLAINQVRINKLRSRVDYVQKQVNKGKNGEERKALLILNSETVKKAMQGVKIELTDHSVLVGKIVDYTREVIEFETASGAKISLSDAQIYGVKNSGNGNLNNDNVNADPNDVRLFVAPTGRTLKKGEANFSDFYIFFPSLAYGITDFFQLGGGVTIIPGAEEQLLYISPKLKFYSRNNIDLAAGLLYIRIPNEESLNFAYTAVTAGNASNAVTLGISKPFGSDVEDDVVSLLFGYESQLSNNIKFITENWLFTDADDSFFLISGGLRFIGNRLTVGFGVYTFKEFIEESDFPFFPWLDFSYSFGKNF